MQISWHCIAKVSSLAGWLQLRNPDSQILLSKSYMRTDVCQYWITCLLTYRWLYNDLTPHVHSVHSECSQWVTLTASLRKSRLENSFPFLPTPPPPPPFTHPTYPRLYPFSFKLKLTASSLLPLLKPINMFGLDPLSKESADISTQFVVDISAGTTNALRWAWKHPKAKAHCKLFPSQDFLFENVSQCAFEEI